MRLDLSENWHTENFPEVSYTPNGRTKICPGRLSVDLMYRHDSTLPLTNAVFTPNNLPDSHQRDTIYHFPQHASIFHKDDDTSCRVWNRFSDELKFGSTIRIPMNDPPALLSPERIRDQLWREANFAAVVSVTVPKPLSKWSMLFSRFKTRHSAPFLRLNESLLGTPEKKKKYPCYVYRL